MTQIVVLVAGKVENAFQMPWLKTEK